MIRKSFILIEVNNMKRNYRALVEDEKFLISTESYFKVSYEKVPL